ncbi:cytochrome P450 4V2-like [Ixodes scapularis]
MYINVNYATAELFNILLGACELFKNKTFKVYNWMMPLVMIQTAEAAETLLNRPGNFTKPLMYTFLIPWLGEENVLTGTGEKWRLKRKLATPALHLKMLDNFMDVFNEHGNIMVDKMKEVSDKAEPASIYRYVQRCTLDITAELSTGVNPHTQTDEYNVFGNCLSRYV